MIDFLRANPFVTKDEYMWQWSYPAIQIASYDFTHVEYLTEEQAKKKRSRPDEEVTDDPLKFAKALNIPIVC